MVKNKIKIIINFGARIKPGIVIVLVGYLDVTEVPRVNVHFIPQIRVLL